MSIKTAARESYQSFLGDRLIAEILTTGRTGWAVEVASDHLGWSWNFTPVSYSEALFMAAVAVEQMGEEMAQRMEEAPGLDLRAARASAARLADDLHRRHRVETRFPTYAA